MYTSSFYNKTILVAPLDWGIGHAIRCIPIIHELLKHNTVVLGVTPLTQPILTTTFPHLQKADLPAYNIRYSKRFPLWLKLLIDTPRILKTIRQEKKSLKKIIEQHSIDIVISDNRFGLYHSTTHSVFITHQLFIQAGLLSKLATSINQAFIKKFTEVWVPDHEDVSISLSGQLSHGKHSLKSVKYIGPLSRFKSTIPKEKKYDYLILLSGPEPQRTLLENQLLQCFSLSSKKIALVRGLASNIPLTLNNTIDCYNFPNTDTLQLIIESSDTIICRSGYSTLMDLYALHVQKAILIPTPGQPEQLYLAEYWSKQFNFKIITQAKYITEKLNFI